MKIQVITEAGLTLTLNNAKFYYVENSPKWIQKDLMHLIELLLKQNYGVVVDGSTTPSLRITAQKGGYEISLVVKRLEEVKA